MTEIRTLDPQVETPAATLRLLPRRFVLRIVNQDITQTDADCLVVNHYAGPQVTGAALDVDKYVNKAISHAANRGELDAPAGRITFIPARRSPMTADVVAVLSMGQYEEFTRLDLNLDGTEENIVGALQRFGRNMAIACCDAEQRDVATVAHGAGNTSKISPDVVARHLVVGYWQGLQEAAKPGTAYSLILVEKDASKCLQLVQGVKEATAQDLPGDPLTMRRTGKCQDPAVTLGSEEELGYAWIGDLEPEPSSSLAPPPPFMRLGAFLVEQNLPAQQTPKQKKLKLTVFGNSGADQAVWDDFQADRVREALNRLRLFNQLVPPRLRRLEALATSDDAAVAKQARNDIRQLNFEVELRVRSIGTTLYNQIFNPHTAGGIRKQLAKKAARNLLLRLEESTVQIPWELMSDDNDLFCLGREVGRQMELPTMVRNYMMPSASQDRVLRVLLVSNPDPNLPEVEREAKRIVDRLHRFSRVTVQVTHLSGKDATPLAVLSRVDEDGYDVFHFAGHAHFDPIQPNRSGLVMGDGKVLTVESISRITEPPPLIFFNACETARTRPSIPPELVAEMDFLQLLDDDMRPLAGADGGGTNEGGTNGGSTNEGRANEGGTDGAARDVTEIVNRFFGNLPVSMVSTLLQAGITNFVGTTWQVEDSAAAEFAVGFYANLADGKTVGAAMRNARKQVIDRMSFGHLGWASYVLYGAPWNRIV